MNKYQEALENIKQYIIETCYDDEIYETSISDLYPSEFSILQKLVDKATPKKTIKEPIIRDGYRQYKNYCPICKQELLILGNYCLHCGQAVDWSDNDEFGDYKFKYIK